MKFKPSSTLAATALLLAAACGNAFGSGTEESSGDEAGAAGKPLWGWEVKRQNTGRGEPGESTKTTLRLERYPGSALALLRLDVPLPDEQTDFAGSPLHPRLGDIKFRLVGQDVHWGSVPWSLRTELTFPTADPASLGAGKLQLMLGARTSAQLGQIGDGVHRLSWAVLLQQTNSLAGDAAARDINNSKADLELLDTLPHGYSVKLTLKPVIDWVLGGKTGAVLEWEGGVKLADGWRVALMLGGRAWGEAVAGTYSRRFELTLGRRY